MLHIEKSGFLPLVLMIAGSILFLSYLSSVTSTGANMGFEIFIVGTTLLSSACAIISLHRGKVSAKYDALALVAIYVLAVTLLLRGSVRFKSLSGIDNLFEFRVARDIQNAGFWLGSNTTEIPAITQLLVGRDLSYYSSLAYVIPVAFSDVAGISLYAVFEYFVYFIGALVPVFVFATVRTVFRCANADSKLALVSSVLVAQSSFFFTVIANNFKEQVALILLLVFIWGVVRTGRSGGLKWVTVSLISMFGIILSHYTITYFSIIILAAFAVCALLADLAPPKLLGWARIDLHMSQNPLRSILLLLVLSVSSVLAWFNFAIPWLMSIHLGLAERVLGRFSQMGIGFFSSFKVISAAQQYSGVLIAYWNYLSFGLIVLGALYLWRFKNKDIYEILYVFAGTLALLLIGVWMIFPALSRETMSFDRVFSIFSPLLFAFSASLLIGSKKRIVTGALLVFVFANLFMNLLIPSNAGMVLYHPDNEIAAKSLVVQWRSSLQGLYAASWTNSYVEKSRIITTDFNARRDLTFSNNPIASVADPTFFRSPYFPEVSVYLLIPEYSLQYGFWVSYNATSTYMEISENATAINWLCSHSNSVYSNGLYTMLEGYSH